MSISALWAELREFIRRLGIEEAEQRSMRRDLLALSNDMRDAWTESVAGGFKNGTFHGKVGARFIIDGIEAVLSLRDQTTGAEACNVTTDSAGNFGPVPFVFREPSQTFDVVVTPTSSRLDTLVTTSIASFSGIFQNYSPTAASGFVCWGNRDISGGVVYPIATTLNVANSRFGTGAVVRGASPHFPDDWTTPATFPAVPTWDMQDSQSFFTTTIGGVSSTLGTGSVTSYTAPGISTKMSITWTAPAGDPLYTAGDTVTVFEP